MRSYRILDGVVTEEEIEVTVPTRPERNNGGRSAVVDQ